MGWKSTLGPKFDSLKSTLVLAVTKSDHNKRMLVCWGKYKAEMMSRGAEKNSAWTRAGPENVYCRRMSSGEPPRVAMDLYSHLH